jgi:hypothetical protein
MVCFQQRKVLISQFAQIIRKSPVARPEVGVSKSGSQWRAPSGFEIIVGAVTGNIQLADECVGFDPSVPFVRLILFKPTGERLQIICRQSQYRLFQFLNAHACIISDPLEMLKQNDPTD